MRKTENKLIKKYMICEMITALVKIKQSKKERGTQVGQERHSDKVQRHAEIKGSHSDIWVGEKGEKEHSDQRRQWGQGPEVEGSLGVFGKSKEVNKAGPVIKVR